VKVPLGRGEAPVAILTNDNDEMQDDQFVAYRKASDGTDHESPVYLTYITADPKLGQYRRVWSAPTAATDPATISLYTADLLGDHSVCIILTGLNGAGKHTLTAYRKNPAKTEPFFRKVAEITTSGSITVNESARSQAYQMGLAAGKSFPITAYEPDPDSHNIMDQVEVIYAWNETAGLYVEGRPVKAPGAKVEQRRIQELLGNEAAFRDFLNGLWYFTSDSGTVDKEQYIYFDPEAKEIIFCGDDAQQVFGWNTSTLTRFGLYISSQNISVSTLRRSVDIELQSLDSIKVKVFEDVRLKIAVSALWDGVYRKAQPPLSTGGLSTGGAGSAAGGDQGGALAPFLDASFDGPIGRIHFFPDAHYELARGAAVISGKYAFFTIDGKDCLELRPDTPRSAAGASSAQASRETYLVKRNAPSVEAMKTLSLRRIHIGADGIEDLHEGAMTMSRLDE
jgi:hypothetical protein